MIYTLRREQHLGCDITTAWNFFTAPTNLARITPGTMRFKVLSDLGDRPIYRGMIIDYEVAPLFGIGMHWRTKISQIEEGKSFTDLQIAGPYKLWRHFHEFIADDLGVIINDRVDYELPWGILGRTAHALIVKRKLNHIFDYRHKVLETLFNKKSIPV